MNCTELRRAARNLALTCGVLGAVGCVVALVGSIAGILLVEHHNPISETISKLAVGRYAWIQDLSLDFFAGAVLACGVGLYAWNLGKLRWKTGTLVLVLVGIVVILIAEHNQYAGRPGPGATIHIYLVYAFGLLLPLSMLLLAFGLRRIHAYWYRFSLGLGIIWLVLAPAFFFVPTSWDGAYERFIGLLALLWVTAVSYLLLRRGTDDVTVAPAG